jgi:tRNA(Ile)-lysidine synthase
VTAAAGAISAQEFAALLAPLGPFEKRPRLAAGCSGGADSLALTVLADGWARARGGDVLALILDHGLRPESAAEAQITAERLARRRIAAKVVRLAGLRRGPGLAARARGARMEALQAGAARDGRLHLLLGHHAADQAETLAMRALSGSGPSGLAGMSAIRETEHVRLLRPLLATPPGRLRATLRALGMAWVEDPSNADPAALRARLRAHLGDRDGPAVLASVAEAAARGRERAAMERRVAAELARRATIRPEGFVLLTPGPLMPESLAALLCLVAGRVWAPPSPSVARLAADPRPATLGGCRLLPAGRLLPGGLLPGGLLPGGLLPGGLLPGGLSSGGLMLVREAAAMAPPCAARDGVIWDRRFRLGSATEMPELCRIGPLGGAAARFRDKSHLPAAVLRTLPAIWRGETLAAIPHLGYARSLDMTPLVVTFAPPMAASGGPFCPCAGRPALGGDGACEPGGDVLGTGASYVTRCDIGRG